MYQNLLIGTLLACLLIAGIVIAVKKPSSGSERIPRSNAQTGSDTMVVSDSAQTFSMELPKIWEVTHQKVMGGPQISNTNAKSPDYKARVEQPVESPSSLIYYETGANLYVYVSTGKIELPYHHPSTKIIETKSVVVDSIEGEYHSFVDLSIEQGISLDTHVNYQGKNYGFSFVYNPATYPQGEKTFMEILKSVKFLQ